MPELYHNFLSIVNSFRKYNVKTKTYYYSSYDHATAQKLYVQARVNKPFLYDTQLLNISSEVMLEETKRAPNWVTDHLETILINDEQKTRCHEVFNPTNYPHTFTVPNNKEGKIMIRTFIKHIEKTMIPDGKATENIIKNLRRQIKVKHVGVPNGAQTKSLHFWLEHENEYDPDFNGFQEFIDNPTEMERKYRIWDERTDSLGFLVSMEYMPLYLRDMKNLKHKLSKEGKKFKIDFISAISQSTLKTIQRWNPEYKFFNKTTALKLPAKFEITEAFQFWNAHKIADEMF